MVKIYKKKLEDIKKDVKSGNVNVSVVGFGYVGLCLGLMMAEKGLSVIGIDTNSNIVEKVNRGESPISEPEVPELLKKLHGKKIKATSDYSVIKDCDVILVTVGTPLNENFAPVTEYVSQAAKSIGKFLQKGHLVILKSTVTPETTEGVVLPILEKESGLKAGEDFGLAFCPERLAEGKAIKETKTLPIIIGGIDNESSKCISAFWNSLGLETFIVSDPKTAEMSKLADNLWIDLNIALANELAMLCEKIGVDVLEVIQSANTLPKGMNKVNILIPGPGVGGSCLVKDPWFIYHLGKKYGLDLKTPVISRTINEFMPRHMFDLVIDGMKYIKKDIKNSNITVFGFSFKGSTGDIRSTPAKNFIELLIENGANVTIFDPWVDTEEVKKIMNVNVTKSLRDSVKDADCIAVVTDHPEFKQIDINELKSMIKKNCVIVDGKDVFDQKKLLSDGFIYRGIGKKVSK
jgi:UDP-N-acetyl-D-mannosaminuronic acid dehydrogenase